MKINLTLKDDWKAVLTKAWSVRFMAIGIACEGIDMMLPKLTAFLPSKTVAIIGLVSMLAGFAARHVKQKDVT